MFMVYSILVEIQFIRAIPQFLFKLYNEFQTGHTSSFHCHTIIPHCNQQLLPVDSLNLIYVDLSQNRIPSSWMVEHMYITFLSKHAEEFGQPHIVSFQRSYGSTPVFPQLTRSFPLLLGLISIALFEPVNIIDYRKVTPIVFPH